MCIYNNMRYTEAELKRIQDKRANKEIIPLEDEEYDIIVKHLNDLGFVYTHIPMETFTRYIGRLKIEIKK